MTLLTPLRYRKPFGSVPHLIGSLTILSRSLLRPSIGSNGCLRPLKLSGNHSRHTLQRIFQDRQRLNRPRVICAFIKPERHWPSAFLPRSHNLPFSETSSRRLLKPECRWSSEFLPQSHNLPLSKTSSRRYGRRVTKDCLH